MLLDLPEEEFIIDDEDFVIQETKSDIKIFEEEIIPEEKVIANEQDQNDDILNEIVRMLPKNMRQNRTELKELQKNLITIKN